jgi:hypothetical protein
MRFKEFKEGFQDMVGDDEGNGMLTSFLKLAGSAAGKNMKSLVKDNPIFKQFVPDEPDQPDQPGQPNKSTATPSGKPTPVARSRTGSPANTIASTPINTGRRTGSASSQQISSYLASKGLSRQHIGGIMANIKHESSFNPAAIGDGGTSGGLFQHHGPRFQAMVKAAGPNWKTNWKGQIDFALSEPAGRQYTAMSFRTAEEASRWFTINFEVPANKVAKANDRSRDASQFA